MSRCRRTAETLAAVTAVWAVLLVVEEWYRRRWEIRRAIEIMEEQLDDDPWEYT